MIATLIATLSVAAVALGLGARLRGYARRTQHLGDQTVARLAAVACVAVALPTAALAIYLAACLLSPRPGPIIRELAPGIQYERRPFEVPRPGLAHLVRVEPDRGHGFVVTAPTDTPDGLRTRAATTREAFPVLDADLLVNASFFRPFRDAWFLDYRPKAGAWTEPIGTTISGFVRYGLERPNWPTLCIDGEGRVSLGAATERTEHAVSGRLWLVRGGAVEPLEGETIYPRTAVGLDREGRLWIVVVDGKQPGYSEGLRLRELAALLVSLGIEEAIELDGGGSAALAVATPEGGRELLNRPIHTQIPRRERPVANHLGIKFARE